MVTVGLTVNKYHQCFASLAFKPDATVKVTVQLNVNKYNHYVSSGGVSFHHLENYLGFYFTIQN